MTDRPRGVAVCRCLALGAHLGLLARVLFAAAVGCARLAGRAAARDG